MKMLLGLLVIAGIIYSIVIYSKQSQDRMMVPKETKMTEDTTVSEANMMTESGVVVVEMTGNQFRFSQSEIKVKLGDKVRVVLTSVDMPHDFDLDELSVNGPVGQPGETTEVEFVDSKLGEFEYYCSVGQHRKNGMIGKLVVTE
jgi:plastocyanin